MRGALALAFISPHITALQAPQGQFGCCDIQRFLRAAFGPKQNYMKTRAKLDSVTAGDHCLVTLDS